MFRKLSHPLNKEVDGYGFPPVSDSGRSDGRWIDMQIKPRKQLIAAFIGPNKAFRMYLAQMRQTLKTVKAANQ